MQGDLKIFQSTFLNFSTSQTECLWVLGFCKGVYLEPLEVVVEKCNPQCKLAGKLKEMKFAVAAFEFHGKSFSCFFP